jgi:hypothetical protein
LQGASATQSLLERIHDSNLRIHESGVEQFWDKNHLVAHEISQELAAHPDGPQPPCCTSNGNLWDFVAVYPKQALWQTSPPKPVFADGPVVKAQASLNQNLDALSKPAN